MSLLTRPRSLILEPANLVVQPNLRSGWTATRAALTPLAVASPSGSVSAASLVEDGTATNTHDVQLPGTAIAKDAAALKYRFSLWTRRVPGSAVRNLSAFVWNSTYGDRANFVLNLDTRLVQSTTVGAAFTVERTFSRPGPNEWVRYGMDFTTDAASTALTVQIQLTNAAFSGSYSGDSASGVHLWGVGLWRL